MLSKRDILEISCKVLGLFCLIRGIPYMSSVALTNRDALASMAWPFAFYLIAAFVLLRWATGIASLLARDDQPVELKAEQGWQKPIYTLCLRVVGAVALVKSVPMIIRAVLQIILRSRLRVTPFASWISLITAVVYLSLGIYFIGGAKEIVRIAMKGPIRERGSNNV